MTKLVYPIDFFLLKIRRQKFSADYFLAQMVLLIDLSNWHKWQLVD